MDQKIKDFISNLNEETKKEIIDYLTESIIENSTTNTNISGITCPYCKGTKIIKYGKQNGVQRLKCSCGKIFSSRVRSIFYHSKISKATWRTFIQHEISFVTLKEQSFYTNKSITTCFSMRHKLYEACYHYIENNLKLTGPVELDASYTNINLKGTKPENMPRLSKKRGTTKKKRGLNRHKICVVTATDDNDNCYFKIVGLGAESIDKFKKCSDKFENSTFIISDSKASIKQFSNLIGKTNVNIPAPLDREGNSYYPEYKKKHSTEEGYNIQATNELCKTIEEIVKRHHGVNTRYLNKYLTFRALLKTLNYKFDRDQLINPLMEILETSFYKEEYNMTLKTYPISLKEAYWDYHYGIFSPNSTYVVQG